MSDWRSLALLEAGPLSRCQGFLEEDDGGTVRSLMARESKQTEMLNCQWSQERLSEWRPHGYASAGEALREPKQLRGASRAMR